MLKPIAVGTAVAGTLDILAAAIVTLIYGRTVEGMLRYVASGPFPPARLWGAGGALLGLLVHFALMVIMVMVYVLIARRSELLRRRPVWGGIAYGIVTYVAMNLAVVPLRFGAGFPPSLLGFATQFSFHVLLVGIPIALITARYLRPRSPTHS